MRDCMIADQDYSMAEEHPLTEVIINTIEGYEKSKVDPAREGELHGPKEDIDSDELSGSFSDGEGEADEDAKRGLRPRRRQRRVKGGKRHQRKFRPYVASAATAAALERKTLNENFSEKDEEARSSAKRQDLSASGHPLAPFNTTQFLIEDHNSPFHFSPGSTPATAAASPAVHRHYSGAENVAPYDDINSNSASSSSSSSSSRHSTRRSTDDFRDEEEEMVVVGDARRGLRGREGASGTSGTSSSGRSASPAVGDSPVTPGTPYDREFALTYETAVQERLYGMTKDDLIRMAATLEMRCHTMEQALRQRGEGNDEEGGQLSSNPNGGGDATTTLVQGSTITSTVTSPARRDVIMNSSPRCSSNKEQ